VVPSTWLSGHDGIIGPTIHPVEGPELVDALRTAAELELPALPVTFAYLYGSRTGTRSRPDSDVDVGIALDETSDRPETVASRVADVLAARSSVGGIEVTVLNDAPIRFLGRVLRSRIVLYSRDEPARSPSSRGSGGWRTTWRCGRRRWTASSSPRSPREGADVVDELRVRAMLDRLGIEIDALRRLAGRSDAELLGDDDVMAAVKYRFIVAIEVCTDVGRHVVASEGLRAPLDYADVFAVLAEAALLDRETAEELRDAARFRNLLVHGYAPCPTEEPPPGGVGSSDMLGVDDGRVVEILRDRTDDLARFRTALAQAAAG
jgi:uncharacterized protein YutE (UPF0331/DUF86 family)/predicted nucleotidyltransferase